MLEIKNPVVVIVFSFLKHYGQCERLADSKYFYKDKLIPCTNFRVPVTPFACTQFVQTCSNSKSKAKRGRKGIINEKQWRSDDFW